MAGSTVTELERLLAGRSTDVPALLRVFVIEEEYERAMVEAELRWIRSLVDDLGIGRLTWYPEALRSFPSPEWLTLC